MAARIALNMDDATHRFPTYVHWGEGYFGDGMRYLSATSDAAALAHHRAISAATELQHLQRRMPDGKWRNCRALALEAQQIMRDISDQPGVQRLLGED